MKPTIETMKALAAKALPEVLKAADALYGLNLASKAKATITTRAARSHGGSDRAGNPSITIHVGYYHRHTRADGSIGYWEYEHYKHDDEIGSKDMHWTQGVIALLAHEVAHVVQMVDRFTNVGKIAEASIARQGQGHDMAKANQREHGADFQAIYRELRVFLIGA